MKDKSLKTLTEVTLQLPLTPSTLVVLYNEGEDNYLAKGKLFSKQVVRNFERGVHSFTFYPTMGILQIVFEKER